MSSGAKVMQYFLRSMVLVSAIGLHGCAGEGKINSSMTADASQSVLQSSSVTAISSQPSSVARSVASSSSTSSFSTSSAASSLSQPPQTGPKHLTELDGTPILDPLFSKQYQLTYDGREIDGFRGYGHLDTRVLEAWSITKGDPTIGIGVFDRPVGPHEDLPTINYFEFGDIKSEDGLGHFHGTGSAGIMVAQHNNIGIRGISPNSPLYAAFSFPATFKPGYYPATLKWMSANNVGVVNQSFLSSAACGYYDENMYLEAHRAMIEFFNNARSGLGGVIVNSAGNSQGNPDSSLQGESCIAGDGMLTPSVITVSGFSLLNKLTNYSQFGVKVGIAAPTQDMNPKTPGVYTTTRADEPENDEILRSYTDAYGGTSAAAPVISGVVSLIIAANPELTAAQVTEILYLTAQDVLTPGFDIRSGHGFVDAYAAVLEAKRRQDLPHVHLSVEDPTLDLGDVAILSAITQRLPATNVTYQWDLGDGHSFEAAGEQGINIKHHYKRAGEFKVTLQVVDAQGAVIASDYTYILISQAGNLPPLTFALGLSQPLIAAPPYTLSFIGGYGDSDLEDHQAFITNQPKHMLFETGDGTQIREARFKHTYEEPGEYTVSFTLTDPKGASASFAFPLVITKNYQAPAAAIDYTLSEHPLTVLFSADKSLSGTLGYIQSYRWDFGDGTTSDQAFPKKIFSAPGQYTVTLAVEDLGGYSTSASQVITVMR